MKPSSSPKDSLESGSRREALAGTKDPFPSPRVSPVSGTLRFEHSNVHPVGIGSKLSNHLTLFLGILISSIFQPVLKGVEISLTWLRGSSLRTEENGLSKRFSFYLTHLVSQHFDISTRFFFCFPKRKSSKKKRGNLNMLPDTPAEARPRLSWASAHANP